MCFFKGLEKLKLFVASGCSSVLISIVTVSMALKSTFDGREDAKGSVQSAGQQIKPRTNTDVHILPQHGKTVDVHSLLLIIMCIRRGRGVKAEIG